MTEPRFLHLMPPEGLDVPERLPNLWYGPPAPVARWAAALMRTALPDGFSGRVGVVVAVKASGADDAPGIVHAAWAAEPAHRPAVGASVDYPTLPAADGLVEPMEDDDFERAAAGLVMPFADGSSRTLLDLARELTAGKPKSIARGGGAGLKLTYRHWNRAMADAFQTPAVRLGILMNTEGVRLGLRPAAYFEWWAGETPPHDVKWDGMPLSPRTTAKPVIERLWEAWSPAPDPRFTDPAVAALAPRIIEEAEDWIVIEKPSGLLSVPGAMGLPDAMSMTAKVTNTVLVPVHRLDMDTSGLLVYAKTDRGTKALMAAFREGRVEKRYRALLEKRLPDALGTEGEVRFPITTNPLDRLRQCAAVGGRESITRWKVLGKSAERTLVEMEPVTGRTHQLRLHAAHALGLNAPMVNDPYYGFDGIAAETPATPLNLHAAMLDFPDPVTGERRRFETEPAFHL